MSGESAVISMTAMEGGAANFSDPTFLREESISFGGIRTDCYVVTVSPNSHGVAGSYTWWIDKQTYRILREDNSGSSTVYTSIKLGEALSGDLFKFTPPPGAKKIDLDKL